MRPSLATMKAHLECPEFEPSPRYAALVLSLSIILFWLPIRPFSNASVAAFLSRAHSQAGEPDALNLDQALAQENLEGVFFG